MRRIIIAALFLTAISLPAAARVERIEILSRQEFASGVEFGDGGAYEKLRGRAFFALDPNAAANAAVTDLKLAPRNARGLVEFSAEFLVLRPKETARRNGTLLYEVNNRGNIAILRQLHEATFSNDPATVADAGNGFLFQQGVTLVWSAWAADVAARPGDNRLVLRAPVATNDGTPITGKVAYELIVDEPRPIARFTGLLGIAYPFATDGAPDAVLTERERPEGERRPIARAAWSFVQRNEDGVASEITLDGGFKPGRIYELVYTARDPIVAAAGMAGIRDLLSYLRNNPLAGTPAPQRASIFGISQSGRLIQTMLLRGLNVDEDGRAVFDGAFIHVAGGGKGGFDYRFAMPTRHFSMLEDHIYPTDFFPFTTVPTREPVTGAEGARPGSCTRARGGAETVLREQLIGILEPRRLAHRDRSRRRTRFAAGAGGAHLYDRRRATLCRRAARARHLRQLRQHPQPLPCNARFAPRVRRWVRDGTEPPPSTYPRIADGTLVTLAAQRGTFPRIADFRLPESNLRPPRLDLGARFETERVADQVPPVMGEPFVTLVPRPDADGNDQGGISPPELRVPLGTRTGFNTRNDAAGFPWATGRWDGSFLPFARTEAERQAAGDPRPSLEARYAGRGAFEAKVRSAAVAPPARVFCWRRTSMRW